MYTLNYCESKRNKTIIFIHHKLINKSCYEKSKIKAICINRIDY